MAFSIPFDTDAMPSKKGVYVVGGSVRDIILERNPTDYDIVVSNHADLFALKMAENLSQRVIKLGKPDHALYRIVSNGFTFDISPLTASTILKDLANRDFTINAVAYSLQDDRIIDPGNGIGDLEKGIIRMVSEQSFKKDPIRLLRAFRIASELNFVIEPNTIETIKKNAAHVMDSAGERIRNELMKLFRSSTSSRYIQQMVQTGLLFEIFPGFSDLAACLQNDHHDFDTFEHTLNAYGHLEQIINNITDYFPGCESYLTLPMDDNTRALLKLSILLHDIGKPATKSVAPDGSVHFYGHASKSAQMAAVIGQRIKLSKNEMGYIDTTIRQHNHPLHLFRLKEKNQLTPKGVTRFFLSAKNRTPDILVHSIADHLGKKKQPDDAFVKFANDLIHVYFSDHLKKLNAKRLVTGYDLINTFGLTPSPIFKTILDHIEEQRLSDRLKTRTEALTWVEKFLDRQVDSNS